MDVLGRLLTLTRGDTWGRFLEGYPLDDDARKMPAPIVTWRLLDDQPDKVGDRVQLKPRVFKEYVDEQMQEGQIVYAQPIWSRIRIGCWERSVAQARELAHSVEELMVLYADRLMRAGVVQILWIRTTAEQPESDRWRTDLVPYFIDYHMRTMKTIFLRTPILHSIDVEVQRVAATLASSGKHLLDEEEGNE